MRSSAFGPFVDLDLPLPGRQDRGTTLAWPLDHDRDLIVTTDRVVIAGHQVGAIAFKGQVHNEMSAWWSGQVGDIIAHHAISVPDPHALIARTTRALPLAVTVTGYLTGDGPGSLWERYRSGTRSFGDLDLADGLNQNATLPAPVVVEHPGPARASETIDSYRSPIIEVARALYRRGAAIGQASGLVLASATYRFGIDASEDLVLTSEIHTPDTATWWIAHSLDERRSCGNQPDELCPPVDLSAVSNDPSLVTEITATLTSRLVMGLEHLTGDRFEPGTYPVEPRLIAALSERGVI